MPKPILATQTKYLESTGSNSALDMLAHMSPEHMHDSESDNHHHHQQQQQHHQHHHNLHHQQMQNQYGGGQRYGHHHHHHQQHNHHHQSPTHDDRESTSSIDAKLSKTQIKSSQSPAPGGGESSPQSHNSSNYYNPQTYLDANNNNRYNRKSVNNNNSNGNASQSPHPQQSHTTLNSSNIGGVINNLINSTLIHGNVNNSAAAAAASTAAAAAATAYLLNNQNGLTPNGAANLILANLNNVNATNLLSAAASAQQHHQQQQLPNPHQQYADESKCHVCGDKSTGSHFGGISCESCKAFFRRSVQRNRFEDYKCSYSGECKMNTNTRKICQFCRYKSCLAIGMKPKWVLSDDERHQKYGSRRKNKLKQEEPATRQSSIIEQQYVHQQHQQQGSLNRKDSRVSLERLDLDSDRSNKESTRGVHIKEESTYGSNSDDDEISSTKESSNAAPSSNSNKNEINRVGVDGMDMRPSSLNLNAYEKDLIDRLSIAFYHSRKFNSIDLNVQKKIAYLFQTQSEGSLKKMSKVILANFIVQPVKRVITFAKLIPDFRKLDINDQMCLLQGGTMEIFICSSSSLYDQISNKFVNVVSKDRNIQGNDSSSVQLDMLRLIWSEDIFEKTIGFLKSMSELRIDEATLILILPLILFSPDRRELRNRYKIYQIQAKYSFLLKKYMIWKYGLNEETIKLYNRLLLKLVELRSLHEMHSSILLDADPTQLEPFPLALILNEKEESSKLKLANAAANAAQQPQQPAQQPVQVAQQQQQQQLKTSDETAEKVDKNETMENSSYHINSAKPPSNGSDHYSNFSILTPASSNYGQISSVSSPSAQTSPAINFDTNNIPTSNAVEVAYE